MPLPLLAVLQCLPQLLVMLWWRDREQQAARIVSIVAAAGGNEAPNVMSSGCHTRARSLGGTAAKRRGEVKNYSTTELTSLLECIHCVLLLGNDQ